MRRLSSFVLVSSALVSISCGGGGGGNNGGGNGGGTPPPAFTITTTSSLPDGLQGHPYSTTLSATGGQGALHWTIGNVAVRIGNPPVTQFVDGLTIDPNTGVISGIPTFALIGAFTATVTDSASHTASASFTIRDYSPLASAPAQTGTVTALTAFPPPSIRTTITGGYQRVTFTVSSGTIPPGMRFDDLGRLVGVAYALGTYQFIVTAQDSYSPPETASQPFTITVLPPPLSVAQSLPSHLALNRQFSGRVIAMGGTPPYSFSVGRDYGPLPTGLSLDAGTGIVSGTPTVKGSSDFTIAVSDSSTPAQNGGIFFHMSVDAPLGRNDSPATATAIDNGSFDASISPYIDPPNGPPLAADNDYYKLVSVTGATVSVGTIAKRLSGTNNPLDTVIEIVDGNGIRLNSCRQPGDTTPNFTGPCINDDISASPHVQDSALDLLVPGPTNTTTTFYVHVFDWRGNARPDMTYSLQVGGLVKPMVIVPPSGALVRGAFFSQQLRASSHGVVSWSIVGGSLPPGLTLSTSGLLSGTTTTDGSYTFTLQASDAGPPVQVATADVTMVVAEPLAINFSGTMPNACANQPYSFQIPTTGGIQPFYWIFGYSNWPTISLDPYTGTFSGTTNTLGTFTGTVSVSDAASSVVSKGVTLTVQQCP